MARHVIVSLNTERKIKYGMRLMFLVAHNSSQHFIIHPHAACTIVIISKPHTYLQSVLERAVAIPLSGHNLVQRCFHIGPNIAIRILVDRKGRRRMLDENIGHANVDLLHIRANRLHNVVGD